MSIDPISADSRMEASIGSAKVPTMKVHKAGMTLICTLCAIAAWNSSADLIGTEFSGGAITGPVLSANLIGGLLLIVAAIVSPFRARIAASGALLACILCSPLYLYWTFPHLFVQFTGGEWAHPPQESFAWHGWPIAGLVGSLIIMYFVYRIFLLSSRSVT